ERRVRALAWRGGVCDHRGGGDFLRVRGLFSRAPALRRGPVFGRIDIKRVCAAAWARRQLVRYGTYRWRDSLGAVAMFASQPSLFNLDARYYVDPALFERERQAIFRRHWHMLGPTS